MVQLGRADTDESLVSRDDVYGLLSNHRRRYALHAIKQNDGPTELSNLAEQVAAWENGKVVHEVTSTERHRVYTSMQQTHLPALERAGVITHDNGTITLTEQATDLDVYLDVVPGNSIPWAEYYLGLSAVALALVAAVWVGVFPEWIPKLAWATLISLLFLGSAAYHVYQNRSMRLGEADRPPEVRE
ncbi:hypothetical protein E6P09_17365 (plasmid) [Haloferax mediterranei ATCC 33500]|uniref:DUF7344 domain-containing protein n=1 Tax=Haloferax mediterranei (strain ATCC 33500 / DSM 1411 / JCM 8866 / NBRC 14739 / NCIMB 2177 / R-4) TaxID=523841 RepID=I3RAF5_HALMT|nr:hypothetical protein [Haloferax mediterranei]AFK21215.1 hypothetical protein HFX_6089 [Haloferax mediterranei ATCC 33500]AHZ24676.1 hypothetical protein BM92_17485 [Haloferax mediterranei ATCC 33500]ELZ97452.1 hypothetical protein C439_19058 [Haloferax mediterranei ATCC 33500]MDX5990257.1 hypothetical protein [Haloferax mediterranei ATCC 33500]QCQ77071.1 hypothetical protein E6P09_17365 [Haloferax mediterranei ATCC 33500]